MAETDSDQKTEQATERHLEEAMEQGRFARVPELSVLLMMVAGLTGLAFTAESASERLAGFSIATFTGFARMPVRSDTAAALMSEIIIVVGGAALPIVIASAGAALLAGGLQTGFRLTPKVLGLNWERLSLANGFGRVFSTRVLTHTAIDALKLIAIGGSLYVGARTLVHDPLFGSPVETSYLGRFMYRSATAFITRIVLSLGAIAAISFAYEKFKTAQDLKMTRQEVKDERRSSEGDNMLKGSRRRLARRLLQKQMLKAVPVADVVVTNPTHYAVALKYERGKDKAPVVLAKGENRFATRIKELAAEHGVPMVENKPVARMLFSMGRVGEVIPNELYQAVAQILAVVYRTNRYYFHRLKARRVEMAD
jgi:flagellar biosynthetic protein FlhB